MAHGSFLRIDYAVALARFWHDAGGALARFGILLFGLPSSTGEKWGVRGWLKLGKRTLFTRAVMIHRALRSTYGCGSKMGTPGKWNQGLQPAVPLVVKI